MLKNISVRAKLFVLLVLPLAALLALAAGNVLEKYRIMRAMDMAQNVANLSLVGSALIHELQTERGLSAGCVAQRGAYAEELPGQRKVSDAARQTLAEKMDAFSAANPRAEVNALFVPLTGKLRALENLRPRIDNYNIAPSEAIAVYSEIIARLEDILRGVLDQCLDAGLYARAVNFLNLIYAKEFAGQERAVLNAALASRRFSKPLYRNWVERVALQRVYLQNFLEGAGAAADVYRQKVPDLLENVEVFRQAAVESQGEPRLNGDARAWFAASTAYTDALYEVEMVAARELEQTADTLARSARQTLYFSLGVILAIVLCTLLLARAIVGSITRPLRRSLAFAQNVAAGELNAELQMVRKDEFGVLGRALQTMLVSLRETLGKADEAAAFAQREAGRAQTAMSAAEEARVLAENRESDMVAAAERIAAAVDAMSTATRSISDRIEQSDRGAKEQSARLEEVVAAMEEMSATVRNVARNSSDAAATAEVAGRQAQAGSDGVAEVAENIIGVLRHTEELKESMTRLGLRVRDIDKVLNVITDIADQTNLLALNAAIEAARAGDAGRGFAVVADEVRKLAEKTMAATGEVGEVLSGIQRDAAQNITTVDQTVEGMSRTTELTRRSDAALREIVNLSGRTSEQIRAIAVASERQAAGSETISRSVEGVNRIAEENVVCMDQSAEAVRALLEQTRLLENLVRELQRDGES
ncbi:methyl-accepting chemotaxis protein [uncultured Desulfovibrio sp.]|uniref:methyl-accepting chemotaxis protein n=1 Tax=uncultured Desulfovibrio sp. TaxID=167968 RepID=UPI002603AEA4|nr:methyl-accepting chemotaxis protein [uncultured Desulfovibrio sp.]